MTAFDRAVAVHKPVEMTVRVPLRSDLIAERDRLLDELNLATQRDRASDSTASIDDQPEAPVIAARIGDLEDEIDGSTVDFVFQAVPRRVWRQLLADHPPTVEQAADAARSKVFLMFNPDTYPPALMAACCIEPEGATPESMTELWDNWSEGQTALMFRAALHVNQGSADAGPKSVTASIVRNASALNSATAGL